jgi:cyclopropane fatty-acyl-phospholipid synthase-like methyltransferase
MFGEKIILKFGAAFKRRGLTMAQDSQKRSFPGSADYWQARYAAGKTSGVGSYGDFAAFKAEVINSFILEQDISNVIEFGCGDGNQLTLANYPSYLGVDVSETAIELCRSRFQDDPSKRFATLAEYSGQTADLALSLDVIYHLVEDEAYESHLRSLFSAANRFVIVYSSDTDHIQGHENSPHVRHRNFTQWVQKEQPRWRLVRRLPNRFPYKGDFKTGSFSDFFFFERT